MTNTVLDHTGKRFGKLTVISYAGKARDGHSLWLCRCDCGNFSYVQSNNIRRTKSCGCYQKEVVRKNKKTHGEHKSRLYTAWINMRRRCSYEKSIGYKNYGGRGIRVCEEWDCSFFAFRKWAYENGYKNDLTIDRINNDGNYTPENCRWADMKQQGRNNSHNKTWRGKCLAELCEMYKMPYGTVKARINRLKWPFEKALTIPVDKRFRPRRCA